jgi:hypothetical protein
MTYFISPKKTQRVESKDLGAVKEKLLARKGCSLSRFSDSFVNPKQDGDCGAE